MLWSIGVAISERLDAEAASADTFEQMSADFDALVAELVAVVQAEIDRSGVAAATGARERHTDREDT